MSEANEYPADDLIEAEKQQIAENAVNGMERERSMNTTEQKLRSLAAILDRLMPAGHSVELQVRRYAHPPDIQILIHGVANYEDGKAVFRELGIHTWHKDTYSDEIEPEGRCVLHNDLAEGIGITVFCSGLPPGCRIEEFVERIPKTEVIETPVDGQFIEVKRSRVVCGNGGAEKPAQEKKALPDMPENLLETCS